MGFAGSFDDKNQKVTIAMAKLLQRAGVDFAILGPSEQCTGDPARRSGNEYIFQMLAMANIETLNGMGVKKIITQRSEEHTSELQSLMRISYAVFCLKKKKKQPTIIQI